MDTQPGCPLLFDEPTAETGWSVVGPITLDGVPIHSHVVPNCDMRLHRLDPTCWCDPTESEDVADLWGHHSLDKRELYERGERAVN